MKAQLRRFLSLLLGLGLLLNSHQPGLAQTLEEQTVLAALSLNIVRFTSWQAEQLKQPISFCVIGDNVVQQSFASIDQKPVGDKTLQIINLSRLRNFEECNVLYVSDIIGDREYLFLKSFCYVSLKIDLCYYSPIK